MSAPLRVQYLRLKHPFPDALLLFRLGDVYELYDADARVAARELGVTPTARAFGGGERVPLCGVPCHAVEGAIKRLVARGHKVAIAEQIGGPRATNGLIEREVVRVVTPAPAMETHRRPPSGRGVEPARVDTSAHTSMPPSSREGAASIAFVSASARDIAKVSAPGTGGEGGAVAPAMQLAFFTLSAGDADARR